MTDQGMSTKLQCSQIKFSPTKGENVVDKKQKQRAIDQKKYIKTRREKELRHGYIVSISGYDPHSGLAISSVCMFPRNNS
jgi:hypothetical protein